MAGDFNWHWDRNTQISSRLLDWFNKLKLVSVWQDHEIDFTHTHVDLSSCQVLDHFMVSMNVRNKIVGANVKHSGYTPSRHDVIWFTMEIDGFDKNIPDTEEKMKLPDWARASEDAVHHYTSYLHEKLTALEEHPDIHCRAINCNNSDHNKTAQSHLLDVISILI